MTDHLTTRLAAARYRAWHRGTREADYIFGGFFDAHHAGWDDASLASFEALLDEEDVDVMAWALGTAAPPPRYDAGLMEALRKLDYVRI